MTRRVLVLGGGTMQIPALQAAARLGCELHVADGNPNCAGRALADVFHHVDLRNMDGLRKTARGIPSLSGVFTAGTDFSYSVACIAQDLGLPGTEPEVALACSNKGLMRMRLRQEGVPVPRFLIAREVPELPIDGLTLPLVCKPVDNMGSRGVQLVEDWAELAAAFLRARELSTSEEVIIEERITGQEYSVDGLVVNGELHVTGIAERHIFFPPYFVELGHSLPAELSRDEEAAIIEGFGSAVRALGIVEGAAKGDVFLEPGSPPRVTIGEIANRLSGGYMSGWTYPRASGVPLTECALRLALGDAPAPADLRPRFRKVAVERALYLPPGIIEHINDQPARALLHPNDDLFVLRRPGEHSVLPRNNVEKIANVIVADEDRRAAETRALRILDALQVRLDPSRRETHAFLHGDGWCSEWRRYDPRDEQLRTCLAAAVSPSEMTLSDGVFSLNRMDALEWIDDALPPRVPCRAASAVVRQLEHDGRIVWTDSSGPTDTLFWRAFVSAGYHGVQQLLWTGQREVPA